MNDINEIKFQEGKRHQAGMTVPEDFFAKFQAQLEKEIDKIEPKHLEPKAEVSSPSIAPADRRTPTLLRWVSVAACAVVLVTIGLFAFNLDSETAQTVGATEMVAEASDNEYNEEEQMIMSTFNDLYLYDLYCETDY